MNFFEFLIVGGIEFMGFLTLIALVILILAAKKVYELFFKPNDNNKNTGWGMAYFKSLANFAVMVGILGQVVGLIDAFNAIEIIKEVSPALLAGGLKVSIYSTAYGLCIFLMGYVFWFLFQFKLDRSV